VAISPQTVAWNAKVKDQLRLGFPLLSDQHGAIRAVDADPDHTVRPEAEASVEAVRSLVGA
jgi:peroxiredoxin